MANAMMQPQTVLDALIGALRDAAAFNRDDVAPPAAVLWTDKERQWEPLLPKLREVLPQLLTFGPYVPQQRSGPAIWIKCMIARALPEAKWDKGAVPVIYVPGFSRQELRAVDDCPAEIQPLAELQFRGMLWTQLNARDWTIGAFLQTESGGLGLDIAKDAATLDAMRRALVKLAGVPVEQLRGKRLEAEDFNELMTPDPNRELLAWMNDPKGWRARQDEGAWAAFRGICREKYKFDPDKDGELTAAELLGSGAEAGGPWVPVWKRFEESPRLYSNVKTLLERGKPAKQGLFVAPSPAWPQDNKDQEAKLRAALRETQDQSAGDARARLAALETQHGVRRQWVWAQLGEAPLAAALDHLVTLAQLTSKPLGGATPEAMAEQHAAGGWRADAAMLDALAAVRDAKDVEAVAAAINAVYRPWLEASADHFQKVVAVHPLSPPVNEKAEQDVQAGRCLLFADGLRFDVAQKLVQLLSQREAAAEVGRRWSALPAVTPTAKPAISPVARQLRGGQSGEEFRPQIAASGKELTQDRFRQLLESMRYQFLDGDQTGDPSGAAWCEHGSLDRYGHDHGYKLAWRIREELDGLAARIGALLDAGWQEVVVVTDHGWLLLPGGLPKVDMPKFLTATRWGRCAALEASANPRVQTVPWTWNPAVRVAIAPGISCFKAGTVYAHGSLSIQECLVPMLTIRSAAAVQRVFIKSVAWRGLVCKVTIEGDFAACKVDLRGKPADADSSMTDKKEARPIGADGVATVYADDQHEGAAAAVVVIDPEGRIIAKHPTTIGA